ncbi:transformer-2 protein homolog alpha-like isoform X1 [Hetaerina americana]|uniref:transformer-2 protein homolog alpha-like isoform X1 n=1 Tax=Hetaerina americana TaxID=62018 RepID=UPI003A7F2A05
MSDRERSPTHSGSNHSPPANDKSPSPTRSRSREQSRSRSRSNSPQRGHHQGRSYSRSRSYSYSRRMSYRGRYRSRSRSRSPKRYKSSRYSHSRSRSYSPRGKYCGYSDRRREFYRSHSRSPMSNRRRHVGSRDNPNPSRCLGVFGLSIYTTEQQLHHIFSKYGPVERVQVVIDAKTGRSRGFSFVYFESTEDAKAAKEQCTGMEIDGRRIRVDYSITQRAHTPTPGIYMGKPTYMAEGRQWNGGHSKPESDFGGYRGGGGSGGGGYRRSPSPYYRSRRRYDRSRSRSYSPRNEARGIG